VSVVPNNMRLLYALLPCYLSKKDPKLDALFTLLAFVTRSETYFDQQELPLLNHTTIQPYAISIFTDGVEMKRFSHRIIIVIASELCNASEYLQAIQLLSSVVRENTHDIVLLSALARIYLQIGNTVAANIIFNQIERDIINKYPEEDHMEDNIDKKQSLLLLNTNRGFQGLASGAFDRVISCFEKVLKIDKNNGMAANNLSLGWLYNGDLQKAIKCLEDFIHNDLQCNLRYETVILNLCTLYDLACHDSTSKKRNLLATVAPYLNDNFDINIFKIPDTANPIM